MGHQIQGFIFNWKEHEANALALQKKIGKLINVIVINSDERLKDKYPTWVPLDDTAYFSAQWNTAVYLFDADIFFHIQADAEFDRFDTMMEKAKLLFQKYKLGVYEPNVNYTGINYDKSKLRSIEPGIFEVPFTDCTCWYIDGAIVRELPPVDISINQYGWGIPRAIASVSWLNGKSCVRDYNFTIGHPKHTGYSSAIARRQLRSYGQSLIPRIQIELLRLENLRFQLSAKPAPVSDQLDDMNAINGDESAK